MGRAPSRPARSGGDPRAGAARILNRDVQALLDELNAAPGPPAHEVPIAQARAAERAQVAALCGAGDPVAAVTDVRVPSGAGDVLVRAFHPGGSGPPPVIAYLHGGGWALGSLETYDAVLRALANDSGALVAAVDYRLAPEHRFPAGLEDCLAAVRWLAVRAGELGGDGARLAVAGDSAGGNLATVVARRLRGEVPLRMQALVYPVTDAGLGTASYRDFSAGYGLSRAQMERFWRLYLDGADPADPDASPLRARDLDGVPPAYVLTAEADVLRDEGEAYADALRRAGVPVEHERWPGVVHGFFRWQAACGASREAVRAVAAALARALS